MTIKLLAYTREKAHEFYKNYIQDPAIFTSDEKFKTYEYKAYQVDDFFNSHVGLKSRKYFAIDLNGRTIGEISLKFINKKEKSATLSIALINDSVKGLGYGTEAEKLFIEYGFTKLGLDIIYADTILRNTRSQHVLEKVGFKYIKTDKDLKYYELRKEDWLEAKG